MKQHTKYIALVLAVIFCIAALSGCGSTSDDTQEDSPDSSSENESETLDLDDTASEDVIGEVTYASASYLSLDVYTSEMGSSDYVSLDPAELSATGETDTVTLDSDVTYQYVSDGSLYTTTADDIAVGDMVVVTTDDSGAQTVIILDSVSAGGEENNASEASDGTSNSDYDTSSYSDTDI